METKLFSMLENKSVLFKQQPFKDSISVQNYKLLPITFYLSLIIASKVFFLKTTEKILIPDEKIFNYLTFYTLKGKIIIILYTQIKDWRYFVKLFCFSFRTFNMIIYTSFLTNVINPQLGFVMYYVSKWTYTNENDIFDQFISLISIYLNEILFFWNR